LVYVLFYLGQLCHFPHVLALA